jgi:transposase
MPRCHRLLPPVTAPPPDWAAERAHLQARVAQLERQVAWFQRQLFGEKSERRHPPPPPEQLALGAQWGTVDAPVGAPTHPVRAHQRQGVQPPTLEDDHLFFDPARVPMKVIHLSNPAAAGLADTDYMVIGEKVSYRLAQRPGRYVILKYVRPVIKRQDTHTLSCPPSPPAVLEGGRADVSFLAGLILDTCLYHLPLYRQHQRLLAAGITVSRQWLTQQVLAVALLLAPIVAAQLAAIRT